MKAAWRPGNVWEDAVKDPPPPWSWTIQAFVSHTHSWGLLWLGPDPLVRGTRSRLEQGAASPKAWECPGRLRAH